MLHDNQLTSRRQFLGQAALSAAAVATYTALPTGQACASSIPYKPQLRDRLWMWGHETDTIQGHYKIPKGRPITQAEGIRYLGIPNDCVTRYKGQPAGNFDEYVKQFSDTRRIAWSIVDSAPEPYEQKKRDAFELAKRFPKLTTIFLDDFFIGNAKIKPGMTEAPAHLTMKQLIDLHAEVKAQPRPLDLAIVFYTQQLGGDYGPHLRHCDIVGFWTWRATELVDLESNFEKFRKVAPDKRVLLGIYMWDFGNSRPITDEMMKHQCEVGLRLFKEKQIEGMIFHCTPLCGLELSSVEYAKKWIAEHADVTA